MIRRLSRYLLASASLLVTAVAMLPTGCMVLHRRNCSSNDLPCADDHTEQLCLMGEGSATLDTRACPFAGRCVDDTIGVGHCVAAREGESCISRLGCADSPLCVEGKCSALTPAVVSACSAAPVLHIPTAQDGPDGVSVATSFEPGEIVVSAGLEIEGEPLNGLDAKPCAATLPGSERVITLELPATSPADSLAETDLVVTIEGLDPKAVSAVNVLTLDTCGDPRTLIRGECGDSPDMLVLTFFDILPDAKVWTLVLQATEALTKSVPFTVRAQLVVSNPK